MSRKHFFIYSMFSFFICFYFYCETIGAGKFSIQDDYFGLFRSFPSDADIYLKVADEKIVTYHRNLGPGLIIKLFKHNYFIIFLCQFLLFQYLIYEIYLINKSKIFLTLVSLPLLQISVIFPNKEFYTIACLCMIIIFSKNKRLIWLILSIFLALISRPEFVFFIFTYILLYIFRKYFLFIYFLILLIISIFYENIYRIDDYRNVLERAVTNSGSISLLLDDIARNYYAYVLVFPFKVLATIYDGGIVNILIFFTSLIVAFFKINNKSLLILLLLFLFYATIPSFPHFRYLLPLYILLFYIISDNKEYKLKNNY